MKVTRAQAQANRQAVVEAAGRLFREHGVKGVGLAELMGAAGLTHGGFYKQFESKDKLVAEACGAALAAGALKWTRIAEAAKAADERREAPLAALVRHYLSPAHRDRIGEGCALAGLGPDAVRHDASLRPRFEEAVRAHAEVIERAISPSSTSEDDALAALSTMVGALLLARMVEDEAFSRRILDAAAARVLDAAEERKA
jgi:TetR/AcrR family transcriptional repressor of nem operon